MWNEKYLDARKPQTHKGLVHMAGNGVNKAILIGNLGADPELRTTKTDKAVCNFRIATGESWTDQAGQKQERTEWHNIVVWGKQAEACGKYLTVGRQVYVEGKITHRKYTNKDNVEIPVTDIVVSDGWDGGTVQFLGGGKEGSNSDSGDRGDRGGSRGGGGGSSGGKQSDDRYDDDF